MNKIFYAVILILFSSSALSQRDTLLVFNNVITQKEGQMIKKADICSTDTIKTNIPGLSVVSYYCSTTCAVDFLLKEESNVTSKNFKGIFCRCLKHENQKIYFEDIVLIDNNGNRYFIKTQVFRVRL